MFIHIQFIAVLRFTNQSGWLEFLAAYAFTYEVKLSFALYAVVIKHLLRPMLQPMNGPLRKLQIEISQQPSFCAYDALIYLTFLSISAYNYG